MYGMTLSPQILKVIAFATLLFAIWMGFEYAQHRAEQRGYNIAQNEYTQKALIASEAARKRERELQTQMEIAQHEARSREVSINAAADAARAESNGLRRELTTISDRLSKASADSLRQYARTANVVLQQCIDRYSELANKADKHASDTLMLQQAWPK